jgi:riboflavin transporter FmnP
MKISVRKLVTIGVLAALSSVIMYFEFPLPMLPPFLNLDFSEIPALLAAFAFGPLAALFVELVKNLIHLMVTKTMGVGELANFLIGISFVVPAGLVYKNFKDKKGALISLIIATLSMVVFASLFNYFALLPLYAKVLGFPIEAVVSLAQSVNKNITDVKTLIIYGIIPFNVFKGIVLSVVTIVIYKRLSPILHTAAKQQSL